MHVKVRMRPGMKCEQNVRVLGLTCGVVETLIIYSPVHTSAELRDLAEATRGSELGYSEPLSVPLSPARPLLHALGPGPHGLVGAFWANTRQADLGAER